MQAYRAGKAMALQWRDKRVITFLTTLGTCNLIQIRTHRGQHKEKPEVVQVYNQYIGIAARPAGPAIARPIFVAVL